MGHRMDNKKYDGENVENLPVEKSKIKSSLMDDIHVLVAECDVTNIHLMDMNREIAEWVSASKKQQVSVLPDIICEQLGSVIPLRTKIVGRKRKLPQTDKEDNIKKRRLC
eukprot:TRINITY_DN269_c0_g2_i1.p1 TRINITY_DN269_c0_g2~~TRINITY_DN269_c0_g2_i1.p1  ORF type:complete len:110 (+),score=28.33 TRINITY_DN269_c0_g2_i1:195-524(+)